MSVACLHQAYPAPFPHRQPVRDPPRHHVWL